MSAANYTVQTRIRRPAQQVFDAIVDPGQLQRYFVESADGPLAPDSSVVWHWKEWGDYPVRVKQVVPPRLIELELDSTVWKKTSGAEYKVQVRLEIEPLDDASSLLKISETGWLTDAPGLKASHENCSGWTHMAMCLKGYLEHGLDLR